MANVQAWKSDLLSLSINSKDFGLGTTQSIIGTTDVQKRHSKKEHHSAKTLCYPNSFEVVETYGTRVSFVTLSRYYFSS